MLISSVIRRLGTPSVHAFFSLFFFTVFGSFVNS